MSSPRKRKERPSAAQRTRSERLHDRTEAMKRRAARSYALILPLCSCPVQSLSVYNWRTKSSTDKWSNHSKSVTRVCHSSKLRMVFSASRDTTIRQWRTHTFKEVVSFRGHTLPVTGLCLAPTAGSGPASAVLLSGARDYSLRMWSVETATQTAMKTLPKNIVTNLRWVAPQQNMDGNAFVAASVVAASSPAAAASSVVGRSSFIVAAASSSSSSIGRSSSTGSGGEGDDGGAGATAPPGGLVAECGGGFDANCLLQCSEDRLNGIRVWDVRTMEVVATFCTAGSSAVTGAGAGAASGAGLLHHTMDAMSDPNDANYFVSVSNVHRSYGAPAPGDSVMSTNSEAASGGSGCYGELKLWDRRRASSNLALGTGVGAGLEPLLTIHAHSDAINALTYLPAAPSSGRNSSFIATASKDKSQRTPTLTDSRARAPATPFPAPFFQAVTHSFCALCLLFLFLPSAQLSKCGTCPCRAIPLATCKCCLSKTVASRASSRHWRSTLATRRRTPSCAP